MGIVKGGALRLFQTILYAIAFLCAAVILGIYSYFLATLADRHSHIQTWVKAVEGISGAAALYTIFAVVLTCCLGGVSFFALLAIILDLLFFGGMIAIAILTRHGATSCHGIVNTPIGTGVATTNGQGFSNNFGLGPNDNKTYRVSYFTACRLNTACFAISIIAAFLFLCTAAMQVFLGRHHKKEKRYGPSPSNNYTSGFGGGRKFWQRRPKAAATRDAEMAGGNPDMRPSYETGTTVGNSVPLGNDKVADGHAAGTHSAYYTQPQGTGVNPYGYERTTGTATNY